MAQAPHAQPFAGQQLLTFFPTLVWVFDLVPAERDAVAGDIAAFLARAGAATPGRTDLSLQTDHDFHTRPEFNRLGRAIDLAVRNISGFLQLDADRPMVTGCWINVSPPGARHHEHAHPNNYLSGVYYIAAPPGAGQIAFHDPRPQAHVVLPPMKRVTGHTGAVMTVAPAPGRLILFHSWLRHSVDPNEAPSDRISLSFNVMFEDFGERYGRPLWRPRIPSPD
ncbi:2OG-Fe(II) oxygenase family protein [Zavarzinia sp. CC-PAN008]|uniref:2OG-Fe(II) oxygenase family protein n=1 Tax=Zavarzinia sp. CC-PAN008 TaxID=3243332 RepID=UPI003F747024